MHNIQPNQQQQQPTSNGTTNNMNNNNNNNNNTTTNGTSNSQPGINPQMTNQIPTNFTMPPFMQIPPFIPTAFMPPFIPPPMPTPPQDLSGLSMEELQAMEGTEREHIEARIKCLRNVQTLLDAAVIQLQQYNSVVSRLPHTGDRSTGQSNTNEPTPSSSSTQPSNSHASNSNEGLSLNNFNIYSTDPQEVMRQRRLQRFSQTQPPVIDSNTGSVITEQQSNNNAPSTSSGTSTSSDNSKKIK